MKQPRHKDPTRRNGEDDERGPAGGLHPDHTRAVDVMTADVAFARSDEPLLEVTMRMLANEIRHLPIVEDEVVVGMISARDALQALAHEVGDGGDA